MNINLKNRKIVISIFFVSLLLVSVLSGLMLQANASDTNDDGWLDGWQYRKTHTVSATEGADVGYTIAIKAYYSDGTDGEETVYGMQYGKVYCDSLVQKDFGDVRFTQDDGVTLLSYWLDELSVGNYATFWVKINGNLTELDQTIYLYYGNAGASSISNGESTFLWFDDASVDGRANYTQVDLCHPGMPGSLSYDSVNKKYTASRSSDDNTAWEISYTGSDYEVFGNIGSTNVNVNTQFGFIIRHSSSGDYQGRVITQGANEDLLAILSENTPPSYDIEYPSYPSYGGNVFSNNELYRARYGIAGCYQNVYCNGLNSSWINGNFTSGHPGILANYDTTTSTIWNLLVVRSFLATEPVHNTWGQIETLYDYAYSTGYDQGWNDALDAVDNFTASIRKTLE